MAKTRHGKQRYKCKDCGSSYAKGDNRLKHGLEKCIKVINVFRRRRDTRDREAGRSI